ncbi:uncharacterized protein LOC100890789 [Strongylocentrotus purpuratus]|uniref:TIR domain-containing protein n=1 Tax=Strongylocentrotus purpuratus TaxID=7668 RepID=A0A7M7NDE2_STRPU|nr:uncharacterized protein LOC100890789 [Strongylocentrotus purpuratus]
MSSVVINDFDDILKVIAKALFTNSDIDDLGKALGFEDADIGRANDENTRQGGNYMGTYGLLKKWRRRQTSLTEKAALRSALVHAGFHDLASKYLSTPITELIMPQTPSDESGKPPKVFLSYQWDHQLEVIAIKKHLEMAGFPCWMDIGQMGGGDKLFAKIDDGIRSSKVVLCMVTEKYSNSENCNKEVNLANLLKKPIIPVLIDNTQWPPKGAMSMLIGELLYIRFFNKKEYVRGEKFWEDAKFSELLGQISYHAESMVTDEQQPRPTPAASMEQGASS